MTIHFSVARSSQAGQALCIPIAHLPLLPANDNGPEPANDVLLRMALRHFGKHGLGASRLAADQARHAHANGDGDSARHWLEICRALDRRLAARTERIFGLTS